MAFASRWTPPPRLRDREPGPLPAKSERVGVLARIADTVISVPKENRVEHEGYRRLVAALPCSHCRIAGYSQAAHPPPTGKSIKEDDRKCFPLCCTRPGITGCHADFDQYRLIPTADMRAQAAAWGRQTRATIERNGDWPAGLARFEA